MITTCKKGKLVIKLCELMNWNNEHDAWTVWNSPLNIKKIEQLIKVLELKEGRRNEIRRPSHIT